MAEVSPLFPPKDKDEAAPLTCADISARVPLELDAHLRMVIEVRLRPLFVPPVATEKQEGVHGTVDENCVPSDVSDGDDDRSAAAATGDATA